MFLWMKLFEIMKALTLLCPLSPPEKLVVAEAGVSSAQTTRWISTATLYLLVPGMNLSGHSVPMGSLFHPLTHISE